tara:strand:- start:234 stop:1469 length:1236 start_codon:yes stop_codon:yes gene_type:complete
MFRLFVFALFLSALSISCLAPADSNSGSGAAIPEGDLLGDCTDNIDNDGDGTTDCDDPGCANVSDCTGSSNGDTLPTGNGDGNNNGGTGNTGNTGNNGGGNGGTGNSGNNSGSNGNTGCVYPSAGASLQMNGVAPALSWNNAFDENGNTVDYDFEDFYCDESKLAIVLVVVTAWCPNCPNYLNYVNGQSATLRSMGADILYMSAQNSDYGPSTHAEARDYINDTLGNAPGLRLGDGETRPTANAVYNSPSINGVPTAFVIERSTMRVIADQSQDQYMLNFTGILQGLGGEITSNCDDSTEETYEPNDEAASAASISAGTFSGGICGTDMDFYQINISGAWRVDLQFTHSVGDLDILLWDSANGEFERDGQYYAGGTSSDDNETWEGNGSKIIVISGYNGATAPYTLTLTDL